MKKLVTQTTWYKLPLLFFLVFMAQVFSAEAQQLSYHGRIVDGVTNLGVTGSIDFKIQVRTSASAGANCIMYEETQTKTLNNGVFVIGINNGVGVRTDSTGYSLAQIFSNKNSFGSFNLPAAGCAPAVGFVYTPAANEGRRVNILFYDALNMPPGTWEPLPTQTVAYVPAALESQNVGGFPSDSLLRFVDGAMNPLTGVSPLNNAQYTELLALLSGSSGNYLKVNDPAVGFTTALGGDVTGLQASTVVGKIRGTSVSAVAPAAGQVLKLVGGVWTPAADNDSLGTVTNVSSGNLYLTIANNSLTPVVTLNVGSTANTVAAGDDPRIVNSISNSTVASGDLGGFYPAPNVAKVGGKTAAQVSTSVADTIAATPLNTASTIVKRDALGNAQFTGVQATNFSGNNLYVFDGVANSVQIKAPAGLPANYVITLPPNDGNNGEVLGTDGSGILTWVSPTASAVTSVTASPPLISSGGFTPNISMPPAAAGTNGYLTSVDWNTFNNKLSTGLANGQVFIGNAGGVAVGRNFLSSDIKSSVAGATWFNVAAACPTGQSLNYDLLTDRVSCSAYSLTSLQVTNALGFTPPNEVLPSGNIYVGNAGGVAAGVPMSGDATIVSSGALTIGAGAVTNGKIANLAVNDAKISDVAWSKITATPTSIAGYGILDAILTNAGGVTSAAAGTMAARPVFGSVGRVYITTDTQEIYRDDGTAWVKVGSAVGSGGTVTNVVGTAPVTVVSGSSTPTISMAAATGAVDGYLTSANFSIFNNKLTSVLPTGQVFVGNGAGAAVARNFLSSDIKSTIAGATWFNVGAACPSGQALNYDFATDRVSCTVYSITSGQVTGALGYTPASNALATANIFVGNAGGVATGVALSGDASISAAGALTLVNTTVLPGANYTKVTVDSKGRITSATSINAADVTTALTYTPLNKAGDTMTGTLTMGAPLDLAANNLVNVGNFSMSGNKTFTLSPLTPIQQAALVAPLTAADKGKTWYNTGTNTIMFWDGTTVQTLASASGAISNLNGLTATTQSFAVGTAGTDFAINSAGSTHTFNFPSASSTNRGLLTPADFVNFSNKTTNVLNSGEIFVGSAANLATAVALSGDATMSNTGALTLKPSGATAGNYTKVLVNAKGLVTSGGSLNATDVNTALGFAPVSSVLTATNIYVGNGANVATGVPLSGDATIATTGALTLANSGATSGSYGSSAAVPTLTIDAKGRVTTAGSTPYQDATGAVKGIVQTGSNITNTVGTISVTGTNVTNALGYTPASNALTTANIFVGNAGGVATGVPVSGDATIISSGALTISAGAITTGKIANLAITDAQVNDVKFSKLTAKPTTIAGYGITDLVLTNAGGVTSAQAGTIAARPVFGSAGRIYITTDTQEIYRDDGTAWVKVGSAIGSGGTVTNVTGTAPVSVVTGSSTPVISMAAATGAVDGYLTATSFNTFNSKLTSSLTTNNIFVGNAGGSAAGVPMSGDASIVSSGALTLANTAVTAATYGSASAVPSFTVDSKGRLTAAGSTAYQDGTNVTKGVLSVGTNLSVAAGAVSLTGAGVTGALGYTPITNALNSTQILVGNAGNVATPVNLSGDAAISNTGALTLSTSGVTAATYGSANQVAQVIVDAKGRITSASNVTIDDNTKLPKAGGAMTGAIAMGANDITGTGNIFMSANKSFGLSQLTTAQQGLLTPSLTAADKGRTWYNITTNTMMYWDGAAVQALASAAGAISNLNGLTATTQSFAVGTAGTDFGISSAGSTHTFNLPTASATNRGLLSSADFTNFSNKTTNVLNSGDIFVGNATNIATGVTLSGDATLSNAGALTLKPSGVTAGSYTKVTVNAKGLVTVAGSLGSADVTTALGFTPITNALNSTQILVGNAGNVATPVNLTGDAAISNTGALTLATSGVAAGTFGSAFAVPSFTVDAKGRITSASSQAYQDANAAAKGIVQIGANITDAAGVISVSGTNVTNALGYTPASNALAATNIFVGNAGGVATGVPLSGDASILSSGALTIGAGAITTGKIANLAITDAKVNDVAFSKLTAKPTTIAGYGITDAILTNAGGVISAAAGTLATRPAFGTAGRVYIATDTQEIYRDDGTAWIKVGSAIGSGGTVTNVTGTAPVSVATGSSTPVISMAAATGAVDGYLTSANFNTFNGKLSPSLASGNIYVGNAGGTATAVGVSGDATLSSTGALALQPSGVTAGTYTKLTVDAKGRATVGGSLSSADVTTALTFTPISNSVASGNFLVGNAGGTAASVAMSGDATLANTGAVTLSSTAVTAASYGSASLVPTFTVDAKGRLTAASSVAVNDTTKLPLAGGTMSGAIAMGSNDITGTGNIFMSANKSFGLSQLTTAQQGTLTTGLGAADKGRTWYNISTNTMMYWDGAAAQALGIAGSGLTSLNGLTASVQTFTTGTAGTDFGISSAGSTHTFNIPTASAANRGALAAADFTIFNNKLTSSLAANNIFVGSAGGSAAAVPMSGDASIVSSGALTLATSGVTAGTYTKLTVDAKGRATVGGSLNSGDVTTALGFTPITNSLATNNIFVGNAGGTAAAVAMSGDASIVASGALTLANTAVTAGTFGSATAVPSFTVDSKGRITAAGSNAYADATGATKGIVQVGTNLSVAAGVLSLSNANVLAAIGYTPLNKAGDTMSGALVMGSNDITGTGNILMSANKSFGLSQLTTLQQTALTGGLVAADKGRTWYNTTTGAVMFWDGAAAQQLATGSSAISSMNGLTAATQTFATGTAGTDFGISSAGSTHTFNIPTASAANRGALAAADFTIFNNKLTSSLASANIFVGNAGGTATAVGLSGDAALSNTGALTLSTSGVTAGTYTKLTVDAKGRATVGGSLNSGDVTTALGFTPITNSLTSGNFLVGNAGGTAASVAMSGDATLANTGAVTLSSTAVTAASYGSASAVPTFTVDAKGRLTAAGSTAYQDATGAVKGVVSVGSNLSVAAGVISLSNANVVAAIGYTPVNKAGDTMSGALAMGGNDITGTGNILMSANKSFGLSQLTTPQQNTLTTGLVAADKGRTWYNTTTNAMMYWDGAAPQALGIAGSGLTSLNGLTPSVQTFATGTAGTDFGISSAGSTHTFNIPTASAANRGALASADFTIFNNKLTSTLASANIFVGNAGGTATAVGLSGDAALSNTGALTLSSSGVTAGTYTKLTVDAKGRATVGGSLNSGDVTTALGFTPITNVLNSTQIFVGSAGNVATAVNLSGDAAISNTGALTLANTAVTAGTFGSATAVPSFTVDAKGRLTAAGSNAYADATGASKGIVQVGTNLSVAAGVLSLNSAGVTGALGYTPLNKAGDTMSGALVMGSNDITGTGNILMSANKSLGLSQLTTAQQTALTIGLVAADKGRTWYNTTTNAVMYWDGAAAQQLATGTSAISSMNGLTTATQTFATGTAGTDFGISSAGSTHTFNIPTASATNRGALASADFTIFNNKLTSSLAANNIFVGSAGGAATAVPMSGDASIVSSGALTLTTSGVTAGTYTKLTVDAKGRATVGGSLSSADVTTALTFTPISNSVASGNILVGNAGGTAASVAMSGDATLANTGAVTLSSTAVTAASYGSASAVPTFTVDAKGRLTAASTVVVNDTTKLPLAGGTLTGNLNLSPVTNMLMGNYTTAQQGTLTGSLVAADKGRTWFNSTSNTVMYWDGAAAQALGVAGAGLTSLNGLTTSTQTFTTGTAGTDFGISSAGSTHTFNIPTASAANRGALAAADFTIFNNKLTSSLATNSIFVGSAGGAATAVTMSGDASIVASGAVTLANTAVTAATYGSAAAVPSFTVDSKGRLTAAGSSAYQDATGVTKGILSVGTNLSVAAGAISLTSGGVTGALGYTPITNALASGNFLVGNAGGTAASVAMSGDATLANTGAVNLVNTAVTAASYGSASTVPTFTVDSKGRLTAASSVAVNDTTKLPLAGGTMTGNLVMSPITNMLVGNYTGAQQTTLVGTLVAADKGRKWFNSTTNKMVYWDGALAQTLLDTTSALTSLNGLSTTSQTFATGTAGTDFGISSAGSTHTFNIPTASAANRGALASADFTIFNNKLTSSLAANNIFVGSAGGAATAVPMSGDASIASSGALTLSTSGVTAGTYTKLTVDAKGRATVGASLASADVTTALGFTPITNVLNSTQILVGSAGNVASAVNLSGDATIANTGALTLSSTAVTAASYGSASSVPTFTVDAKGRLTAASNVTINDTTKLPLAGGTMTGAIAMGGQDITGTGNILMNTNKSLGLSNLTAAEETALIATPLTAANKGRTWFNSGTNKIMYWDGAAAQPVTAGASAISSLNGLTTTTQTFATGTTGTDFGISSAGSTHTFNIPTASAANRGALASADFTIFNNKLTSSLATNSIFVGSAGGAATAVTMSGDASIVASGAVTLANTAVTAATYGSGTAVPSFTVDSKGRLTAASSTAYADATGASKGIVQVGTNLSVATGVISLNSAGVTGALGFTPISNSVASGNFLVGNAGGTAASVAMSGDATLANTGAVTLATSGVTAATYGSATQVAQVAVDAKGRVTSASNVTINDTTKLPLAGGTMTGAIAMGGFDITGSGNILMNTNKSLGLSNLTPAEETALTGTLGAANKGRTWFNSTTNKIMYWDGALAQPVTSGASAISSLNGLTTTTQTFAVGTAGTDFGISSTGSTHTFNIPTASAANRGALASADFTTFNNKLTSSLATNSIFVGSAGGAATAVTMSGDAGIVASGAVTLANTAVTAATYGSAALVPSFTVDSKGRLTAAGSSAYQDATGVTKGILSVGTNLSVTAGAISLTSGGVIGALGSQTQKTFLSGPVSAGPSAPSFRTIASTDLPVTGVDGAYVNGGNSFGSAASIGTNDAFGVTIKANNLTAQTIDTAGATTFTRQAVPNRQTSNAVSPVAFDANLGNIMVWTTNPTTMATGTVNITNVKPGGQYMLSVAGTGTGTITITCADTAAVNLPTGFIPANGSRVAGLLNKTVYSIVSDGTNCLVTWITGF